jgi:hypothetical protein
MFEHNPSHEAQATQAGLGDWRGGKLRVAGADLRGRGAEAQRGATAALQMWGEITLVDLRIFQIEMP